MATLKHLLDFGPLYLIFASLAVFMPIILRLMRQPAEVRLNSKWWRSRAGWTMWILLGLSFLWLLPSKRYSIWEQYVGRDGKRVAYQAADGDETAKKIEAFRHLHPDRLILSIDYRTYGYQPGGELIIRHGSRKMRSDDQMLRYVFAFKHPQ